MSSIQAFYVYAHRTDNKLGESCECDNNPVLLEPCVRSGPSSVLLPGSECRGAFLPGGGADPPDALSTQRGV